MIVSGKQENRRGSSPATRNKVFRYGCICARSCRHHRCGRAGCPDGFNLHPRL